MTHPPASLPPAPLRAIPKPTARRLGTNWGGEPPMEVNTCVEAQEDGGEWRAGYISAILTDMGACEWPRDHVLSAAPGDGARDD